MDGIWNDKKHHQNVKKYPNDWGTTDDVMMTETSTGIWEATIEDLSGEVSFKIRNNKEWTISLKIYIPQSCGMYIIKFLLFTLST